MINDAFLVTFAIGFETIPAFHETALRTHLQITNNAANFVENIPHNIRKQMIQVQPAYSKSIG